MAGKHEPTDELRGMVAEMAKDGILSHRIASYLKIGKTTFYKYYKKNIKQQR